MNVSEIRHSMAKELLEKNIRVIPDFPKEGVKFKDLNPLLAEPFALDAVISSMAYDLHDLNADKIIGVESRGFIYGSLLANKLHLPFVLARKKGKLPGKVISKEYSLEYGTATLELQKGAICEGDKVIVVDDLIATGGSCRAVDLLVSELGGKVIKFACLIELAFLKGREKLGSNRVYSVLEEK